MRQAAVNAIMARCKPEYFPVIIAAMHAFASGAGMVAGLLQSTTGQAGVVVVNGPVRQRLGINCQDNIFSPGERPNPTVGRALRLIIMNALGIRPTFLTRARRVPPPNIVAASLRTKNIVRGSHFTSNADSLAMPAP